MKYFQQFLSVVIAASFVFPPSLTSHVFAYYDPSEDDTDQQTMPEYNQPFQTPQEAVKLPEEEPEAEAEPVEPEPVLNAAGDSIKLNNGVELTEQDDGTFRDEDGNKWVKVEGEDGNESYRQMGFPKGEEIELTDGTKLTADEAYELTEDFKLPDGLKLKDEKGNRWTIAEGKFQQIDFDKGHVLTLQDGTKLIAQADFSVDEKTFDLPDGVKFIDDKNNRWTTTEGRFQQIDFDKGHVITLTDGTKLTAQSDFSVDETKFEMPDGTSFLDDKNNRWTITEGHFQQIDFDKGDVITLSGGTKLTAESDFSLDEQTFKIPDGVKFKDQDGNAWISKDGNYKQLGFSAGSQLTLRNGIVLTAATPYSLNEDGSLPAGALFKDKSGRMYITTADGYFRSFNPDFGKINDLQIMAQLKGMNDADAAALLAKIDPEIAGLILTRGFDSNQKVADILSAMDSGAAAEIVNALFMVSVKPIIHKDYLQGIPQDPQYRPGYSSLTDAQKAQVDQQYQDYMKAYNKAKDENSLPNSQTHEILVNMSQQALDRIRSIQASLKLMETKKAAEIIADPRMSLTSAAKALYALSSSKPISNGEEGYWVPIDNQGDILAALEALDPAKARNVREVLAYYNSLKGQTAYSWQTPTGADKFREVMSSKARLLTADEKTIYAAIFGKTVNQIEEYLINGEFEQAFWTSGANSQGSIQGLVGAIITDLSNPDALPRVSRYDPYQGSNGVDVAAIIASLSPEQQALAESILGKVLSRPEASGLGDISGLTPEAAAEKITGYVKDAATAKEAADALAKLDASAAAAIMASAKLNVATVASILDAMDPANAAAILTYSKITTVPGGRVMDPPVISRERSAEILLAMDTGKAAAIIAAFAGLALDPAIVGGEILGTMPTEKAAELISQIPAANGKTSVQVQASLLAVMSHVIVAQILASDKMPAAAGAAILTELKKTDERRVELFLTQLDTINKVKADQIRDIINGKPAQSRWSYVIDQDGTLFWSDGSRGMPEPGKVYTQALTALTEEEKAQYLAYLKTQDAGKIAELINNDKISMITAAEILNDSAISAETAADIMESLDAAKAGQIMTFIVGLGSRIEVALAGGGTERAIAIFTAMDAAKAAAVFAKTGTVEICAMLNSGSFDPAAAAEIFNAMDTGEAVKIFNLVQTYFPKYSGDMVTGLWPGPSITAKAAAAILKAMDRDKAAKVVASADLNIVKAIAIMKSVRSQDRQAFRQIISEAREIDPVRARQIIRATRFPFPDHPWMKWYPDFDGIVPAAPVL